MIDFGRQSRRLESGGLIDRGQPLQFKFNGRTLTGFEGDSLASALLANGVSHVGRSFKYHRPRGIYSAGEEEPCAIVETGSGDARVPNSRAPMVPLKDGLIVTSQHCWPSLGFDAGRVFDFSHRLWPAGFYNKTFKWPSWGFWEPLVRKAAGLGRPLTGPDPDHYEQVNAHCDLLVCGGGPAGLLAALAACRAGLRVILADQGNLFGGMLNHEQVELDGMPGPAWARDLVDEIQGTGKALLLSRTVVTGIYDHRVSTLLQTGTGPSWRECYWTIRPRRILLATGAIEQGLIFPGNDRPGIMLAGAVRHYLNRNAVRPGRRVVIATNNDSAYQTALDLVSAGVPVGAVVDGRDSIREDLANMLAELGVESMTASRITGTRGGKRVRSVDIQGPGEPKPVRRKCDVLAVSGGWAPRVHLLAHAGGGLRFDDATQCFLPERLPEGIYVAGSSNGTQSLVQALGEAQQAAQAVCESLDCESGPVSTPRVTADIVPTGVTGPLEILPSKQRQWIDLAHDVSFDDAQLAVREGFVSVEHFKRYTTTGMSIDQGKTGNLNAFVVLGALAGKPTGEVGTTTFRPPYVPVTLGAIAGRNTGEFYAPRRYLPAHSVHQGLDARFEDYGWQRPDCYPRPGESNQEAINREAMTVRTHVGVFDNSPIGKLEVRGPDAAKFLNRLYINNVLSLAPGRARYGLMLNENGVIIDDGVFVRLAEDHFLVNPTSGGVGRVLSMMEEWLQCEWPDLRVIVDDTTTQWANFTVAGPRAREVLDALGTNIDLAPAALPHMSVATGHVAGLAARVVRVSFSGELSFEINVEARHAGGLLEAILKAGEPFEITTYGVEALMVLRTEKGYLHVGSDTDGSSTPDDVGWGPIARAKTGDYIGKRSLYREGNQASGRKQLVGLEALDPDQAMRPGGHLLAGEGRNPPAETEGWITSACYSPNLERHIALGVLADGRGRGGEILTVCDEKLRYSVKVVPPVFYDPQNSKLSD